MAKAKRGCGCGTVVLLILAAAAAVVGYKFLWPWWRAQPPRPSGGELQVHVLDVGPIEGDSILIISPAQKSVLVDAGDAGKGKVVLDALRRYKLNHLDYFIASHPHPDHIGGAPEVLKAVKVGAIIDNGVDLSNPAPQTAPSKKPAKKGAQREGAEPKASTPKKAGRTKSLTGFFDEYKDAVKSSGAEYEKAEPGKKYDLGRGAHLTILGPGQPFFTKEQMKAGGNDTNANSIVLRLDYGEFSMLLMGDAEEQTEHRMLDKELNLRAKLLKVAHHGSKYATSEELVKRVQPEVAIISDGAWNRYGHPAQAVLDRLKAAGAQVYRTDLQGEITISTRGKEKSGKLYDIKTGKEASGDLVSGREAQKDDSSRSGFIAYGDFGPPPKAKTDQTTKTQRH